jgi:glutamate-1-semialdehyde 2,1-aminomutase
MNNVKSNTKSEQLFNRAIQHIPGGVNSPVRAFGSVGGTPVFFEKAKGAYLYDVDGNEYIDYINSWGPMILGHAFEPVVEAIREQAAKTTSFGAPTELEIETAELIKSMVKGLDLIRMTNSGTEACMSAIRLARGYTGKNKILKFEGCYHGHADSFLVKAGSGVATFDIKSVPGVTEGVAKDTLTAPFNSLEKIEEIISISGNDIAAIILEPVAGNMGCIPPVEGYLEGIREICNKHNIVLIFDEVMTGFRLAPGGAAELFGVIPDLYTFGKIIGGGLPVGAFGGRKEIMDCIAPTGKVYQAGTLSGNPLAMTAGYVTLKWLKDNPSIYDQLESKTKAIEDGLIRILNKHHHNYTVNRIGSMISVHFSSRTVLNFNDAYNADNQKFNKLFHGMLNRGIYLPPSAFETWFVSQSITEVEIERTLTAMSDILERNELN